MSHDETPQLGWGSALAVFAILAVLRLLAADFRYFFEQDEMSLANGVASIMEGNVGYLYHYGPQVGYYRGVAFFAGLAGGIAWVPIVMSTMSALAGAAIPAATLVAFRRELPARLRLLAAAVVTCSPILWISSQYGNTAVVSAAAGVVGLVILSNTSDNRGMAVGLVSCALAVFLRADAVLLAPVAALLVFRAAGGPRRAMATLAVGALAFVAVWVSLRVLDPLMASSAGDVVDHFGDLQLRSLFWEHAMWGFSPFVLILAFLGLEELADRVPGSLWVVGAWCLPVFGFYFSATTTPRYFLLAVAPVAVLAAAGIERLAERARLGRVAWGLALIVAFAHLVVGLGHFSSADWTTMLTAPSYPTHDGPMPTGALVYQGYHRNDGVLGPSVRRAGPWGTQADVARAVDPQLERVRGPVVPGGPARVLVLLDDWNGHVFQFHALLAGASIVGRDPGFEWMAPTHFALGDIQLTAVGISDGEFEAFQNVDLAPGDEVWHIVPASPFPREGLRLKLDEGLGVEGPVAGNGSALEVYRVFALGGNR